MLSLGMTIVAIVGAAIGMLAIGIPSGMAIARRRHHHFMRKNGLAQGLSTYHRTHLSIDSKNYAHVPQPQAHLRRSLQLTHGGISDGWTAITSQETLQPQRTSVISKQPETDALILRQERRRSLHKTFSAHSFSIPKGRNRKKIEKAIPLNTISRSPLSAITETSGTNVSEDVKYFELPTEVTPRTTPERDEDPARLARPSSTQWPLQVHRTRSQETMPTVKSIRNSAHVRMDSTGHSISPMVSQPSLGPRSISLASTISAVPDDPLPPLPSIAPTRYPQRRNSKLRLSTDSIDTVGSSVLGGGLTISSEAKTDFTSIALASPHIDLNPPEYDPRSHRFEPPAVTLGNPPGKQAQGGYRAGPAAISPLRASIGTSSLLRTRSTSLAQERRERASLIPRLTGSTLTTIDASNWDPGRSLRGSSFRSMLSPSLPAPVARTDSSYHNASIYTRHSMYEQQRGIGRLALNPAILQEVTGNPTSPVRSSLQTRPASVAGENLFQWDRDSLQGGMASVWKGSPGYPRSGHKRQNCVRISNLPDVNVSRRSSKLPQMAEEEEHVTAPPSKQVEIPGLGLLPQEDGVTQLQANSAKILRSPHPFHNRPTLEPISRTRRPLPVHSNVSSPAPSTPSSPPDSDVFGNSQYDLKTANIFAGSSITRRWSISPSRQTAKTQPTTSAIEAIPEAYSPNSPTLPSSTLSSANLFARNGTNVRRKSALLGPRNQPFSDRGSGTASPTPMVVKTQRRCSGDDLRRSTVVLRTLNSEATNKLRESKSNWKLGDQATSTSSSPNGHKNPDPTVTDIGAALKDSSTMSLSLLSPSTIKLGNPRNSRTSWRSGSKGKIDITPSGSVVSQGGTSIWEDVSVGGDSPEPELSSSRPKLTLDAKAYGNPKGQGVILPRIEDGRMSRPVRKERD